MKTKYKYIKFNEWIGLDGKKYWICKNNRMTSLGNVAYNPRWKEWEFQPYPNMGFTLECLRDIADFISKLNESKK